LLVLATFAVPLAFAGAFQIPEEGLSDARKILFACLTFAYYFINYFVIIFFNSALVACAIIRLKGGDPVVQDGIGAAMARLPQIAGWALVSATVGLILKAVESRSERAGAIVANLLGMAWSITTFFVVPILVVEKAGPVAALKRSAGLIRQTSGESLSSSMGIGFLSFLACLPALLLLSGGAAVMSTAVVAGGLLVAAGIVWILVVSLISSAVSSILLAALYIFAAEGEMPGQFDSGMLQSAFTTR
jgi:hypothetical protein